MKKIFITGGHYTPAKAVIDELLGEYEIYYLGRKYAMEDDDALALEYQELKKISQIKYLEITSGRLQRRFFVNVFQSLRALVKIIPGFCQSFYYLLKYKPSLVLSFGGYLALPVVASAWILHIPVITHEQTQNLGLANQIISKFAKVTLTGNPLRKEFFTLKPVKLFNTILITGGNLGTHVVNTTIEAILPELLKEYRVIHQTGDSKNQDYERLIKINKNTVKFLNAPEMAKAMNEASLVISRGGANTVTELAYLGKPAIIIPIPWVQGNEQYLNAKRLVDAGTAEILEQKDLTGESLLKLISKMFTNLAKYQENAPKAQKLVSSHATEKIVEAISQEVLLRS